MKTGKKFHVLIFLFLTTVSFSSTGISQWISTNGPIYGWSIRSVTVMSKVSGGMNLYAGSHGGVYLSTNNGTTWDSASTTLANTFAECLAVALDGSGEDLFTGTDGNGIYRSTDYGASWMSVSTGLASSYVNALAVVPYMPGGTNIFAGTWAGISLSTDNGASWTSVDTGLTNLDVLSISVFDTMLFVGTYGGGIFCSTNNGASWDSINVGLISRYVYALATLPNGKGGADLFAGTVGGGVFLSTDNGGSWSPRNNGFPKDSYDTSMYSSVNTFCAWGRNLFVGTDGNKVYLSTDEGDSWRDVNAGLGDSYVKALAISPDGVGDSSIFAATSNGVWRRPLSEMLTAVSISSNNLPREFIMKQSFPNPFNPTATIQYDLPIQSRVTLKVYNLLGQVVATLTNGIEEPGYRSATWNADNFSSGIYFYRLEATSTSNSSKSFTEVKKMLLLK